MMWKIEMGLLIVIVRMGILNLTKHVFLVYFHVPGVVLKLNVLRKEHMVQFIDISELVNFKY